MRKESKDHGKSEIGKVTSDSVSAPYHLPEVEGRALGVSLRKRQRDVFTYGKVPYKHHTDPLLCIPAADRTGECRLQGQSIR